MKNFSHTVHHNEKKVVKTRKGRQRDVMERQTIQQCAIGNKVDRGLEGCVKVGWTGEWATVVAWMLCLWY